MHDIYLILCLSEVAVDGAVYSSYRAWFVLSPVLLLEPPYECSDQSIQCGSGECFKRLWMISSSQKLPEAHNVPVSLSYCAVSLLGFDESPVFFSSALLDLWAGPNWASAHRACALWPAGYD